MKNFLLASMLVATSMQSLNAQFIETSDLFYGNYSEDYIMRWHFQKLCQHSFDPSH